MYILTKVEEAFCPETYFYSNANVGTALRDIKDALKFHANCEEDIFRIAKTYQTANHTNQLLTIVRNSELLNIANDLT